MSYLPTTPNKQSENYTKNTPDTAETSCDDNEEVFEFDVQPKRKYFVTVQEKRQYIEEYTKKKKTELCKNFTLTGYCKYGNDCSFAHGEKELVPKSHLHTKYKTKPCKRFFKSGYCPYGIRCQYIHDELKDINSSEFEKYLAEVFKQLKLATPISISKLNQQDRLDIQRFNHMSTQWKGTLESELLVTAKPRMRLFQKMTENYQRSFLSDNSSRKSSDSSKQESPRQLNRKLFP